MKVFILTLGMDSHCLCIPIASGYQNCDISLLGADLGQIRSTTSYRAHQVTEAVVIHPRALMSPYSCIMRDFFVFILFIFYIWGM